MATSTTTTTLALTLPVTSASVPRAREAVTDLCDRLGCVGRQRDDVALAVTEACANVIVHAYVGLDSTGATFELDARQLDGELCVIVRDHGRGMLPHLDSPGLGMGLPLVFTLADHADVRCRDGATEVAMLFRLTPASLP